MKALISTFLIVCCSLGLYAQEGFTYSFPDTAQGGPIGLSYLFDGTLTNDLSDSMIYDWEVISTDLGEGWNYTVCDKHLCYFPNSNNPLLKNSATYAGNESNIMKVEIFTDSTAMSGNICLQVRRTDDTLQVKTICLSVNLWTTDIDPLLAEGVSLGQNTPNPFGAQTMINFELKGHAAELLITDLSGRLVETHILSPSQTELQTGGNLAPGLYFYSLKMEGRIVASRKMQVLNN